MEQTNEIAIKSYISFISLVIENTIFYVIVHISGEGKIFLSNLNESSFEL